MAETRDAAPDREGVHRARERHRGRTHDLATGRPLHPGVSNAAQERGIDPAIAGDWQPQLLEIDGLAPDSIDRLTTVALEHGAVVRRVTGGSCVIVGSTDAISDVATNLTAKNDSLSGIGRKLSGVLR